MALLTEADIAERIGVSLATVQRWRRERKGPPYIKIAASVRYRPEDLEKFLDSSVVKTSVHKTAEDSSEGKHSVTAGQSVTG